jgi:Uncharacterized alpha/beta hydrolase domain (DUF2235)
VTVDSFTALAARVCLKTVSRTLPLAHSTYQSLFTFHPLLWDERHEQDPDRIMQVWFARMHSDVGGGYPDDSLSHVPLEWMLGEAANAGLYFVPTVVAEISRIANCAGPMHDSRRGLGGYYRYHTRAPYAPSKIILLVIPPDIGDPSRASYADSGGGAAFLGIGYQQYMHQLSDDRGGPTIFRASIDG